MKVLFVAGFGPIVPEVETGREFYAYTLGLPLKANGSYLHSSDIEGVKEFALWPLSEAAESCFGSDKWPEEFPVPQGWLEFDVEDIEAATADLQSKGYKLLVSARTEPWGQTVTRLLGPEGLLAGISHTPWLRGEGTSPLE
jgi:catechol 2,3-dioxygenase-like lactoylglutathione lyase family enzyme